MPASDEPNGALPELQADQVSLLDTIDKLRGLGVGVFVDLPQMIICGSKSNAKRSIIESISRMDFPVRNDFHTGFVTEIILRHHSTPRFKVSIRPGASKKSDEDLQKLKTFVPTVHESPEQSVSLIEQATEFIRPSVEDGFSDDVLMVEVSGPDQPDLTLIDMPRLYFAEGIDGGDGGKSYGRLRIEDYVLNARSIILPVVSAKIDICAQRITDFADKYDRKRQRILGIITHLDTLEPSSDEEKLWLKAIKDAAPDLPLGLHLVCTQCYETRDVLDEERDEKEKEFFERGDWKTVARQSTGTANLRRRLSTLLLNHVQSSLPSLVSEIDQIILANQSTLAKLSAPRGTIQQQKALLFNLSSAFQRITEQALSGIYTDEFFATSGKLQTRDPRRLRALIRDLNESFAHVMEVSGCRQFIHGVNNQILSLPHPCNPYANIRKPEHRSRFDFELEVIEQMCRDRGLEFPGNASHLVVGNLFRDQSQPWGEIAQAHLMKSWETTRIFVSLLLDHLTDEHISAVIMRTLIQPQLDGMKDRLLAKVDELTASHKRDHPLPMSGNFLRGHPLPVEQSFLARMQRSRNDRLLANLQQNLPSTLNNTFNMEELKLATQNVELAGNQTAASDIVDQFQSYYNNALMIFTNNIATLGVESCLLSPLNVVLTTQTIANMDDSQVNDLFAGIHDGVQNWRDELNGNLEKLQMSLRVLKRFKFAKESKPSIGTTNQPGSCSAHECSSHQSFLVPQGILCNGASTNTSVSPCPSGPSSLNPSVVNGGTVSAPSESFLFAGPNQSFSQSSRSSGPSLFSGATRQVPQTFTPSTFWSPPAQPVPSRAPDTSDHDRNWYWEERETRDTGTFINRYHSICYHERYRNFSPEELRLADYGLGRETPQQLANRRIARAIREDQAQITIKSPSLL
ncbi:hypothetical protein N7537_009432 [Penicillium hordei]|uniref:GED domain-containing protein n=1 Tax=Penicillium hordei TaxID=40994 RepID=A0AAD6GVQ6_9EURO|nr:uncharacterized protein N7537_009432 [Penicillium hordei]KAJ5592528.1 hypothetical protein N7537_009432 [Penicillium hordei]